MTREHVSKQMESRRRRNKGGFPHCGHSTHPAWSGGAVMVAPHDRSSDRHSPSRTCTGSLAPPSPPGARAGCAVSLAPDGESEGATGAKENGEYLANARFRFSETHRIARRGANSGSIVRK
jgi:hypothetical protein